MSKDLSRLFQPRSVAVIGGGAWGASVIAEAEKIGFSGPVWPVHPSRQEVGGRPAFARLEDLPGVPDAVFLAINREASIEAVALLAEMGAGGVVCFASGFAESEGEVAGGRDAEARLVAAAGEMPILGPNCYGLVNALDRVALWPDQHGLRPVSRGVAMIGQSSNMLINLTMVDGLPVAAAVAAGNQAQTGQAALASALLEDPRVTALGLHVEGVRDIPAWEAMAARANALGKPVVALWVGRSSAAQQATLTHTASLAGGEAAARAFFRRLGIAMVESLSGFLSALTLAHLHGALPGARLASMSCSGGEASLVADAAHGRAVSFPPLPEATRTALAAALGPRVHLANPLDYHTYIWGDAAAMEAAFAAMLGGGWDLTLLILDFPNTKRCDDAAWDCAEAAILGAVRRTGARAAVVATVQTGLPEARAETLLAAGIAPLTGLEAALEAVAALAAAASPPEAAPLLTGPAPAGAPRMLDEAAAKPRLAAHGLPVPEGRMAASTEAAAEAAAALTAGGGRVALKGLGIAHKTEAGAVRLGLEPAEVAEAARAMAAERYWVERMVGGVVAELILGVTRDPAFGLTLTIGAGGVLAELLEDTATLLIPASPAEIRAAVEGLRVAALLRGHRGRPAGDIEAVVAAALAVQRFAEAEAGRLVELDINPLIATPDGAVAADALISLTDGEEA